MIEPLTDELRILMAIPLDDLAMQELERRDVTVFGIPVTRLVAEIRRLRSGLHGRILNEMSDAWLEKAAEEIRLTEECPHGWDAAGYCTDCMLSILRKHRDGKA